MLYNACKAWEIHQVPIELGVLFDQADTEEMEDQLLMINSGVEV